MEDDLMEDAVIERQAVLQMLQTALRLAGEAETVCDLWAGDKSVDALRAALSAFCDAYDAWIHR